MAMTPAQIQTEMRRLRAQWQRFLEADHGHPRAVLGAVHYREMQAFWRNLADQTLNIDENGFYMMLGWEMGEVAVACEDTARYFGQTDMSASSTT